MKLNKLFKSGLALALAFTAATTFTDVNVANAEEVAAEQTAQLTDAEMPALKYKYTSPRYGYSIKLPKKPNVIPLSALPTYENEKGEVLIFDNEGYNIKKAYIVMVDAFADEDIPQGLLAASDADKKKAIEEFSKKGLFDFVRVAEMEDGKAGMLCLSAKEIEVDTTGDGVPDEIMTSDNQMFMTYFRGDYGGRFMVGLMQNPVMTDLSQQEYQLALLTFHQWPTTMNDAQ